MKKRKSSSASAKRVRRKKIIVVPNDKFNIFLIIGLLLIAVLFLYNQYQLFTLRTTIPLSQRGESFVFSGIGSVTSTTEGKIVGPHLNSDGRTTRLVEWPTISGMPKPKPTGDPVKDAIDYVIPRGVPFYAESGPGSELIQGFSFDDPIAAQRLWAGMSRRIRLSPNEEQRSQKLTNIFTCDYCCGGPNSVTRIAQCGCQHAYAWKGMVRFFVKYYPEKTDEEILGEMTKAKAMWYPKGMVEDYLVYTGQKDARTLRHGGSVGIQQQFAGKGNTDASASVSDLNDLNSMVGGC